MENSVSVINHRKVIDAHDVKDARGQQFLMQLYRNHKDTMTAKFGRQSRIFTGTNKHWVWNVMFEDRVFHVFCSKRGTKYEVDYPEGLEGFYEDDDIGNKCVRFLEYMLSRLTDTKGRHDKNIDNSA